MFERHPVSSREEWLALRSGDITASSVSALLGVHDYISAYGIWMLKTGRLTEDSETSPAMERGRMLEPVAVQLLRERHPDWSITHNEGAGRVYLRDPTIRLGATIDVFATDAAGTPIIVQIKSVESSVFRRKWMQDGEAIPPLGAAVQTVTEAHLAGAARAIVTPLVVGFGLEMPEIDVPLHEGVIDRVRAEVEAFWRLVESGRTPEPDYGRDAGLIAELYAEDDGEVIDLRHDNRIVDLIAARTERMASIREAEAELKPINAEILAKIGTAATALVQGGRLTAKTVHRKEFTVAASSHRRISFKADREDAA